LSVGLCPTSPDSVGIKPTYSILFSLRRPVLARGGSGDLLTGLTGGLLAQAPDNLLLAAGRGVVWHVSLRICSLATRPGGSADDAVVRLSATALLHAAMNPSELTERQAFMILNDLPTSPISSTAPRGTRRRSASPWADKRRLESVRRRPETSAALLNWRTHFDSRARGTVEKAGATFITTRDVGYPRLLKEIHDPPSALPEGCLSLRPACIAWSQPAHDALRTVGGQETRRRSRAAGFCVVSGWRAASTPRRTRRTVGGRKTAAVLGCGIDIIYPPENYDLYRRITESGAVLSDSLRPEGGQAEFPMRNRVVAGMCEATVVVESDVQAGR